MKSRSFNEAEIPGQAVTEFGLNAFSTNAQPGGFQVGWFLARDRKVRRLWDVVLLKDLTSAIRDRLPNRLQKCFRSQFRRVRAGQ